MNSESFDQVTQEAKKDQAVQPATESEILEISGSDLPEHQKEVSKASDINLLSNQEDASRTSGTNLLNNLETSSTKVCNDLEASSFHESPAVLDMEKSFYPKNVMTPASPFLKPMVYPGPPSLRGGIEFSLETTKQPKGAHIRALVTTTDLTVLPKDIISMVIDFSDTFLYSEQAERNNEEFFLALFEEPFVNLQNLKITNLGLSMAMIGTIEKFSLNWFGLDSPYFSKDILCHFNAGFKNLRVAFKGKDCYHDEFTLPAQVEELYLHIYDSRLHLLPTILLQRCRTLKNM
jgi:hypothetical protein